MYMKNNNHPMYSFSLLYKTKDVESVQIDDKGEIKDYKIGDMVDGKQIENITINVFRKTATLTFEKEFVGNKDVITILPIQGKILSINGEKYEHRI